MSTANVIDALPHLINDARIRSEAAYRAGADDWGAAHFKRFLALWDQALRERRPYEQVHC